MDNKNIFIWSPFTSKIGTINNVINSSGSLIKFSKSKIFNVSLINVFGEWSEFINEIKLKKIGLENLKVLNFIKNWKKEGFVRSRLCYLLIFFLCSCVSLLLALVFRCGCTRMFLYFSVAHLRVLRWSFSVDDLRCSSVHVICVSIVA